MTYAGRLKIGDNFLKIGGMYLRIGPAGACGNTAPFAGNFGSYDASGGGDADNIWSAAGDVLEGDAIFLFTLNAAEPGFITDPDMVWTGADAISALGVNLSTWYAIVPAGFDPTVSHHLVIDGATDSSFYAYVRVRIAGGFSGSPVVQHKDGSSASSPLAITFDDPFTDACDLALGFAIGSDGDTSVDLPSGWSDFDGAFGSMGFNAVWSNGAIAGVSWPFSSNVDGLGVIIEVGTAGT